MSSGKPGEGWLQRPSLGGKTQAQEVVHSVTELKSERLGSKAAKNMIGGVNYGFISSPGKAVSREAG